MLDGSEKRAVTMTRDDAWRYMRALRESQKSNASAMLAIKRKRSWPPSVRAMELATRQARHDDLERLRALIGAEFAIGGY